jgi:hypothetical protein
MQTNFKVFIFGSHMTVLMANHAELGLWIMYSMCFFQFKLSISKPRNLVVDASIVLLPPVFKLIRFVVCEFHEVCRQEMMVLRKDGIGRIHTTQRRQN